MNKIPPFRLYVRVNGVVVRADNDAAMISEDGPLLKFDTLLGYLNAQQFAEAIIPDSEVHN